MDQAGPRHQCRDQGPDRPGHPLLGHLGLATPDQVKADPAKYGDFRPVYVYTGTGGKTDLNYLRLKPGMEQAAAFLETRRYAAYRGATTEFTKMEGQAHSLADKKLWTVISYVRKGAIWIIMVRHHVLGH
jgi:hypothetical protein